MPVANLGGGAEQLLLRFLRHAPSEDPEWFVVFTESGPLRNKLDQEGISTRVLHTGRLRELNKHPRTIRRGADLASRVDADLIFSWMPKVHLYGGWIAKWAGLPAAWYQHGTPELGWMDKLITLQPAEAIVACSQHVADMQTDLWPHRRSQVVYPCVDLGRFDPSVLPSSHEARRRLGLPTDGPLIGMVGRLQEWKGIHTFVDAFPQILNAHPDAHGVIVGGRHSLEPEYDHQIEQRIADYDLVDSISKVGHQSNVPTWMQAMDVVVHASNAEPFGMVVIEAMALGKPVVAGASGGPQEIITEGHDGLLAPFEEAGTLADRVTRLLEHPDEAQRMGQAARERALDFSAADFADRLTSTLCSLVSD
jgi:glycosyltransferase involved in cell wall biosynthesis